MKILKEIEPGIPQSLRQLRSVLYAQHTPLIPYPCAVCSVQWRLEIVQWRAVLRESLRCGIWQIADDDTANGLCRMNCILDTFRGGSSKKSLGIP